MPFDLDPSPDDELEPELCLLCWLVVLAWLSLMVFLMWIVA
jgi:hypothetical protein